MLKLTVHLPMIGGLKYVGYEARLSALAVPATADFKACITGATTHLPVSNFSCRSGNSAATG